MRLEVVMDIEKKYQEALDFLYQFVDYSMMRSFAYSPERFNLDRMELLMEKLGSPHRKYPVVHVAGTKGKGSVSALCASALQAAGYSTGFYTSPHLQEFSERIQVNGKTIPQEEVVRLVDDLKLVIPQIQTPSWFELTTAMAFMYFAQCQVDVAVIEVGLGGRLDSTNVVHPVVSVITSISYDHMAILGNTLAEIASEKGGIIKNGRPVVTAPQKDEARQVIEKIAGERGAALYQVGKDYYFTPQSHTLEEQSFWVWPAKDQALASDYFSSNGAKGTPPLSLTIPLLGQHQVENATTAYAALQVLNQEGFNVPELAIQQGFAKVVWPGRFEILSKQPFLVIDSAHNRDSAKRLRQAMEDYFPGCGVILVFGASEDKDIDGMFTELFSSVKQAIMTQSTHPRAANVEKLAGMAAKFNKPIKNIPQIEDALVYALEQVEEKDVILVTGSLFVAAAARAVWPEIRLRLTKET